MFNQNFQMKAKIQCLIIQISKTCLYILNLMSHCTFFIKPSQNPPNLEQIKDKLISGTIQEKCKYLKQLVKCLVSDETYPPIIMHIIGNIIPVQHKSPQLRKIMLLYWQVIQKCKGPNDKTLKQQIFLACNSLRNDLICHNEYLRGRTLRLISRIMHKGVIQPLSNAIAKNLQHKSSYVRRNAVVCLFNVYNHFGSDIIGDIDDDIEQLLQKQTDLSTKRNAFILLNKTNPQKALKYLQNQINHQTVEEIGDILQLAILKILKQMCKQDPTQKPRLLKIVKDFSQKASQSVKLQCAITSTSISNSALTIKASLYAYVNILAKTNQLNVKKIILDKLQVICKNSNYLQQDLIEDLLKSLQTPSIDIKMKIIEIIMTGITPKTSNQILKQMEHQIKHCDNSEYLIKIIKIIQIIVFKFPSTSHDILQFVVQRIFPLEEFLREGIDALDNILKQTLMQKEKINQRKQSLSIQAKNKILNNFDKIKSKQLIKTILNLFGNYFGEEDQIQKTINKLKLTIGSLPICVVSKSQQQNQSGKSSSEEQRKVFKTVILQDGSYSTQLIQAKKLQENSQQRQKDNQNLSFRNFLAEDSILGGVFSRNIAKLLYKIRKSPSFNRFACSTLMILCSLLRYYSQKIFEVDQAIVQQISIIIRKIINPEQFIESSDELFDNQIILPKQPSHEDVHQSEMIQKNPEDMINFRLLNKNDYQQFDFDDEEVNDITQQQTKKKDFISKLKSLVQLTGPFDPLYSEAFITVNKYDIFFEILLANNTKSNLLNVQIQFSSTAEIIILQKAQSVNLRPFQTVMLRTQIRFTGSEFGVIYGYLNYDNQAGLQQPYLITQEINIDYMQFIQPAKISEEEFKSRWQRCQNEVSHEILSNSKNIGFKSIIQGFQKRLHAKCLQSIQEEQEYFLNSHLYGKSKLGQDFLINIALFAGETLNSTVTIRSKDKAVQEIVYKELLKHKIEEQDQSNE